MQIRHLGLASLLCMGISTPSYAELLPNIGNKSNDYTSSASADLTAKISPLLLLSGVNNMDLGTWDASESGIGALDKVCLWGNRSDIDNTVQATFKGSGADGAFTLAYDSDGNASTTDDIYIVNYTVRFADADYTAKISGNNIAPSNKEDYFNCQVADKGNEKLSVFIPESELAEVPAGTYNGELTLTVISN